MITLITYAPALGEPASSPFCVKAIWLLNMAGLPWQRRDTADPRKMPKQKLPAIEVEDQLIWDSDNIRTYLESQGASFDEGLSEMERATSRAFIRMAEEHMYFHVVLARWGDDAVWPLIRETYFADIPTILRKAVTHGLRKSVLKGADFQGLGRLTPQERLERLEPDLQAITTRLWHGRFLFGDHPTAADASVAAMLGALRATPGTGPAKMRVAEDEILCRYIDRCADTMGQISGAPVTLCA